MFLSRLRIIAALVVGAGVVAGGMVAQQPMLVYQSSERQPPEAGSKGKNLQGTDKEAKEPGAPRILELDWRGRRVAWSPDGKTLAVVTKNESLLSRRGSAVKLWDVEKGEVRDTLAESGEPGLAFQHLVFARNGKTIAATVSEGPPGVGVVKLWDAQTLALKQTLGGDSQLVCVALSPDGKLVAAGDPGKKSLRLWSADTGTLERTLETGEASPWSMAFSPDSKTLVVGGQKNDGSGEVSLWDAETGKLKHTLKQEKYVAAVAFAPNGKMVASAGGSGEVRLWDLQKGELVMAVPGLKSGTRSVAFSPDSKTVAAPASDNRIRVWDVQTGKLQETLEGHEAEIYSIAFSPDGKTLASVSQDQTLRLWPIGKRAALAK